MTASARTTPRWWVHVIRSHEQTPSVSVSDDVTVGRDPVQNRLVVSDPRVGRRHAVLGAGPQGLSIRAVDDHEVSAEGHRVASGSTLGGGAVFSLGRTRLRVLEAVSFSRSGAGVIVTAIGADGRRTRHDVIEPTRVGRDPSWAELVLDDQSVSSRHCTLEPVEGGLAIEDRSRQRVVRE